MTAMIGWARKYKPTPAGRVRKTANRSALLRVGPNSDRSECAAIRETTGKVIVATATPKTPIGSCMRRKAKLNQDTASFPRNDAKLLLTITLIWTALAAITEGTMRTRIF